MYHNLAIPTYIIFVHCLYPTENSLNLYFRIVRKTMYGTEPAMYCTCTVTYIQPEKYLQQKIIDFI